MPRRKKVTPDKNMVAKVTKKLPDAPIEFTEYPVWNQQLGEDDYWFDKFINFYLQLPHGRRSTTWAYRKYQQSKPSEKIPHPDNATDVWHEAAIAFRWQERAASYWKAHTLKQLEYHEERLNAQLEQRYELADLGLKRAKEILEKAEKPSELKDAMIVASKATEIVAEERQLINTDKAIQFLTQQGFIITDPTQPVSMPELDSP